MMQQPRVINVKSNEKNDKNNTRRVLRFCSGSLQRDFIEEFKNDFLDVEELDFSYKEGTGYSDNDYHEYVYLYSNNKLNKIDNKKLDLQDAEYVAQAILTNIGVKKISFNGQNIGDNGVFYILKSIVENENSAVQEVDFRDCGATETSFILILHLLYNSRTKLKIPNIAFSENFSKSEIYIIVCKLLLSKSLNFRENYLVNIDDDEKNPFNRLSTLIHRNSILNGDPIHFKKIYFGIRSNIAFLCNTAESRRDIFLNIKLIFAFIDIIDFSNKDNASNLCILKVRELIRLNNQLKDNLSESDRIEVKEHEAIIKKKFPDFFEESLIEKCSKFFKCS